MQNCLQKEKRRNPVAKAVLATVAFILAVVSLLAFFHGKRISSAKIGTSVMLETSYAQIPVTNNEKEVDKMVEISTEMNNVMQKNAKTNLPEEKCVKKIIKCENVRVLHRDNSVVLMPLEEYVTACVLGEMPLSFESQALMAQSVAVRTFTVRQALGKSKHKNADVCTNPACCQSFAIPESKNISEENMKKLTDAVNATKGIIIVYDGEPIEAVYHASSGSTTLDSEDVWGGKVEYLRSVKAPDGEISVSASGMGHRVGMSQHGANLLAKEGMNYIEILKYYYSGISFDFLN